MENTISSFPSQVDVESHLFASAVEELDAVVTAVAEPSVISIILYYIYVKITMYRVIACIWLSYYYAQNR